jgi:hypothetical protein
MPNQYESRMKILVKHTRADVPITPSRAQSSKSKTIHALRELVSGCAEQASMNYRNW